MRRGAAEVQIGRFEKQRTVQYHLDGGPFRQHRIGASGKQNAEEACCSACARTDSCASRNAARRGPDTRSDNCSGRRGSRYCLCIAFLVSCAGDRSLFAIQFFSRARIECAQVRTKTAADAIRQRDGVKADLQLSAALHSTWSLHVSNGARHPASLRYYDSVSGEHWKGRFQIYAIAYRGFLRTDAVDHAQENVCSRFDFDSILGERGTGALL